MRRVSTSLAAAPASGTYGGVATLSATVAVGGAGIAGLLVAFRINGTAVGTAITGADGTAVLADVPLGAVAAGSATLSATFAGDPRHAAASATAQLVIARAPLHATVDDHLRMYGQDNPLLTGAVTGLRNGDDIDALSSTLATATSPPGAYAITATLQDPYGRLANYDVTVDAGTLTVLATTLSAAGRDLAGTAGTPVSGIVTAFTTDNPIALASDFAAMIEWGDGSSSAGVVRAAAGGGFEVLDEHTYATAGNFPVTVSITDTAGLGSATASSRAGIRDAAAAGGHVTGGGWFDSPLGASSNSGLASFGFVAKQDQGSATPKGQLQFRVGRLNFRSTSFDRLSVTGNKAQLSGTGTVNGRGTFDFLLTVVDRKRSGGPDRVRITIWNAGTNATLYDSGGGAASDDEDALTPLAGGDATIHERP